jgi:hypothetical protein
MHTVFSQTGILSNTNTPNNALWLGDPVKLDERCSPEAHSPDLWHFRALSTPEQNPALEVLSTSAHPQVSPKGDDVANRWALR